MFGLCKKLGSEISVPRKIRPWRTSRSSWMRAGVSS